MRWYSSMEQHIWSCIIMHAYIFIYKFKKNSKNILSMVLLFILIITHTDIKVLVLFPNTNFNHVAIHNYTLMNHNVMMDEVLIHT